METVSKGCRFLFWLTTAYIIFLNGIIGYQVVAQTDEAHYWRGGYLLAGVAALLLAALLDGFCKKVKWIWIVELAVTTAAAGVILWFGLYYYNHRSITQTTLILRHGIAFAIPVTWAVYRWLDHRVKEAREDRVYFEKTEKDAERKLLGRNFFD